MLLAGFDEVGRGALAGPVFVGLTLVNETFPELTFAYLSSIDFVKTGTCHPERSEGSLILETPQIKDSSAIPLNDEYFPLDFQKYQKNETLKLVRDSKKLTAKKREEITKIPNTCVAKIILSADNNLIDKFGIGVCLSHLLAVSAQKILSDFPEQEIKIIADGKIKLVDFLNENLVQAILKENCLSLEIPLDFFANLKNKNLFTSTQFCTIERENKADDKYYPVALASIFAKVKRDELMHQLHKIFPEYDWQNNVGYGTKKNLAAIKKNPNNPHLRKSFLGKLLKNVL